jgi:arylsulfatase A
MQIDGENQQFDNKHYGPEVACDYLIDFMKRSKDEPFFVYYPMILVHNPFVPTPDTPGLTDAMKFESDGKYFGEMIRYSGKIVERFLDKLDELGLSENTLVIFTADNGTYRGLVSRMGDRVIIGGKALPLDAGVHVPMLAWWKGTIPAASVCNDLIEFSDYLPTVVEAGGAKLPTDRPIDGRSFLTRLKGQPYTPRESIFVHYDKSPDSPKPEFRRVRFAFDGRYKLYLDGRLFDVPSDFEEEHPLDRGTATSDVIFARDKLKSTLDSMPPWQPDNSIFKGGPDQQTRQRRQRMAALTE